MQLASNSVTEGNLVPTQPVVDPIRLHLLAELLHDLIAAKMKHKELLKGFSLSGEQNRIFTVLLLKISPVKLLEPLQLSFAFIIRAMETSFESPDNFSFLLAVSFVQDESA